MPETSCMMRTSVHILRICELNSAVIIRFEILLWFTRCENISGPSRNGPVILEITLCSSCVFLTYVYLNV